METKETLNAKIIQVTAHIQEKYPELYVNLGEMPTTIPVTKTPVVTIKTLQEHYDSLTAILKKYEPSHKI